MPDLSALQPITYDNPVAEFKAKAVNVAGAKLIEADKDEDLNNLIHSTVNSASSASNATVGSFPADIIVASNLPGIDAQLNPDTVECAQELEKVDVGIIKGDIGVAENACIWIPQTMKERAVCFASQQLIIILRKDDIVNNMHEAYQRIAFNDYGYGTFISGPSKTADIAQVLVMGAQAARSATVLLLDE